MAVFLGARMIQGYAQKAMKHAQLWGFLSVARTQHLIESSFNPSRAASNHNAWSRYKNAFSFFM